MFFNCKLISFLFLIFVYQINQILKILTSTILHYENQAV